MRTGGPIPDAKLIVSLSFPKTQSAAIGSRPGQRRYRHTTRSLPTASGFRPRRRRARGTRGETTRPT